MLVHLIVVQDVEPIAILSVQLLVNIRVKLVVLDLVKRVAAAVVTFAILV